MSDSPDFRHPEYDQALPKWRRCRDAMAGQDAVHAAAEAYLPRLTDQEPAEYEAYRDRASFYPAAARTHQGLVGLAFRKPAAIDAPAAAQPLIDDATLTGIPAEMLARLALSEVQEVGRCGVLVEFPQVFEQPASLAQAGAQNLRPYCSFYKAESIINWREARVGNAMRLTLVVLSELYAIEGQFKTEFKQQIRALSLEDGYYVQRLYRKGEKAWEQIGDDIMPMRSGQRLTEIPFVVFGPSENSMAVQNPPLLSLVDVNLSHYRTTADLEHGAHYTGLPTPFIAGVTLDDGEKIRIGSSTAITTPHPEAKASFLEFTGQGLGALEKLLDRKEAQMAAIGARMLAPEKIGVEAEGTLELRHNGENSVLAAQVKLVSSGIEQALNYMLWWATITGQITFALSTDFLPGRMTAQELEALVGAWQGGAISKQTLFANLQMGEIIEASKTFEDEEAEIGEQPPALGAVNDGGQ